MAQQLQLSSSGNYVVAEQTVWRPSGEEQRGVGAFFQYEDATPEVSPIRQDFSGGFQWTGLFAKRAGDVVGFGTSLVRISPNVLSDASLNHECAYEAFYQLKVNSWATLSPDIQYIDHPSADPMRPGVAVATLRLTIAR